VHGCRRHARYADALRTGDDGAIPWDSKGRAKDAVTTSAVVGLERRRVPTVALIGHTLASVRSHVRDEDNRLLG
jgi:hypothetical protein